MDEHIDAAFIATGHQVEGLQKQIADLQGRLRRADEAREHLQAEIERLTLDLHHANEARERAESDRARYWGALWEIHHHEGRVCKNYPDADCGHEVCESSYRAWAIADKTLAKRATP